MIAKLKKFPISSKIKFPTTPAFPLRKRSQVVPLGMAPGLGFGMSVDTLQGQYYSIQVSVDLRTWQDWTNLLGNGGRELIYDSAAGSVPVRFYRVGFEPLRKAKELGCNGSSR